MLRRIKEKTGFSKLTFSLSFNTDRYRYFHTKWSIITHHSWIKLISVFQIDGHKSLEVKYCPKSKKPIRHGKTSDSRNYVIVHLYETACWQSEDSLPTWGSNMKVRDKFDICLALWVLSFTGCACRDASFQAMAWIQAFMKSIFLHFYLFSTHFGGL